VTFTLTVQELATAMLPPVRLMLVPPAVAAAVPPQPLLKPFGMATTTLAGNESLKATPAKGSGLAAGLVMVKVSVETPPGAIADGLNALAIDGGPSTWMVAVAVAPVPPSLEVTLLVVFTFTPAAVPVTFTLNVQEPLAASVPPLRLTTPVPCVAVIVPPPQDPVSPLGVEITRPEGKVSLNPIPVRVLELFALLIVKLSDVLPFNGMLAVPNPLLMVGGASTMIEAVAVLPVPPSVEVTVTLLFFAPAVVPCTFTDTVQLALAANVPPDKLTEPDPLTAVVVPPQVLFKFDGDATTRPAGRLSVKAIPVSAIAFGLVMLKVSEVAPFKGIVAAPNPLLILGALATIRFAVAVFPVPPLVEVTFPVVLVY
jgi:hypothetical protein